MNSKQKKIMIASISLLAAASLFAGFVMLMSAEGALNRFYTYGNDPDDAVAEDMLMDPLIVAGEKVVPLVIREIKNKEMPRRRYAIGFLGNGSYKQALPALEDIFQDLSEKDY